MLGHWALKKSPLLIVEKDKWELCCNCKIARNQQLWPSISASRVKQKLLEQSGIASNVNQWGFLAISVESSCYCIEKACF